MDMLLLCASQLLQLIEALGFLNRVSVTNDKFDY